VYSARFSPDGRRLVTACRDHAVRVWEWRVGQLACPQFEHEQDAVAATFTPDGRWVLSASNDDVVRAWYWRSGKPVTPPLKIGGPMSLAVTSDGRHAVVGGFGRTLSLLDLGSLAAGDDDDPAPMCLRAELIAGQRLHEGGGTVNLSAEEWLDRWRALRRRSVPGIIAPSGDAAPSTRAAGFPTVPATPH
jgi:eukaryotic-like serine/threonine-protein kinase